MNLMHPTSCSSCLADSNSLDGGPCMAVVVVVVVVIVDVVIAHNAFALS